ncbi:MAG: RNA-binding cell elongation regulator Jag/EloR [Anaerolineales bacterium]
MEHRATLETIAPTVDDAVDKGLLELGVNRDQVDIEVLDEGSGGLFGLGSREARVRLTLKGSIEWEEKPRRAAAPMSPHEADNTMSIATTTVQQLLEHMGVNARVSASLGEEDETGQPAPIVVDIEGEDLSILIGRRAETLNALQMITRMIVGKEVGYSAHLIIDVSGYRQRREETLRQVAERMARQAVTTGRRQSLEPMPPFERRIIHLALRESDEVSTESVGEDPRRKVVIIPKQA